MKLSCSVLYGSYCKTVLQLSAKADGLCHLLATGRARYGAWDMQIPLLEMYLSQELVIFSDEERASGAFQKWEYVALLLGLNPSISRLFCTSWILSSRKCSAISGGNSLSWPRHFSLFSSSRNFPSFDLFLFSDFDLCSHVPQTNDLMPARTPSSRPKHMALRSHVSFRLASASRCTTSLRPTMWTKMYAFARIPMNRRE